MGIGNLNGHQWWERGKGDGVGVGVCGGRGGWGTGCGEKVPNLSVLWGGEGGRTMWGSGGEGIMGVVGKGGRQGVWGMVGAGGGGRGKAKCQACPNQTHASVLSQPKTNVSNKNQPTNQINKAWVTKCKAESPPRHGVCPRHHQQYQHSQGRNGQPPGVVIVHLMSLAGWAGWLGWGCTPHTHKCPTYPLPAHHLPKGVPAHCPGIMVEGSG